MSASSAFRKPDKPEKANTSPSPFGESAGLVRAKKLATDYLKHPHSEKELRDKLAEKGCENDDIDTVTALCLDYGFLNDADYGGMIVRHYAARGYGPGRIRQELRRRGIPQDLWDNAMEELPEQNDTVDSLLAARLRGRDLNDRKEREKAANALYRRGFSWDEIRAAMNRLRADDDDI